MLTDTIADQSQVVFGCVQARSPNMLVVKSIFKIDHFKTMSITSLEPQPQFLCCDC